MKDEKSGITSGASWLTIGNVLSCHWSRFISSWATWIEASITINVLYSAGYKPYSLMLAIATVVSQVQCKTNGLLSLFKV